MKKQCGFFLMEFLVYFFLFSIVSVLLMQFIVSKSVWLATFTGRQQEKLQVYTALDVLERELQKAPMDIAQIKCSADQMVWHDVQDSCDIGLCVQEGALYKIKGTFDSRKNQWKRRRRFLLCPRVDAIQFARTTNKRGKKEYMNSLSCTVRTGKKSIEKTVTLYDRIIV